MVQARVTTVEIPVIRDIVCCKVDPALSPYQRKSGLLEQNRSILNFYKAEVGGKGLRSPHPKPPPPQGNKSRRLRRALLEATADDGVGARRAAVVHVERPAILALAIVTATVQARATTVEIPAIRDTSCSTARGFGGVKIVVYE